MLEGRKAAPEMGSFIWNDKILHITGARKFVKSESGLSLQAATIAWLKHLAQKARFGTYKQIA